MKLQFTALNPDDIEFELKISMSLSHWKKLRTDLLSTWPSDELSARIDDMVRQAQMVFCQTENNDES